jgi:hypothetical protein
MCRHSNSGEEIQGSGMTWGWQVDVTSEVSKPYFWGLVQRENGGKLKTRLRRAGGLLLIRLSFTKKIFCEERRQVGVCRRAKMRTVVFEELTRTLT